MYHLLCATGGIKKYQEAFFTEEFRQSTEGKSQQANVQRLKQLMLKQVQILEVCMELHASLAPEGVQPLHKRLFERFTQMKESIHSMDKIKRQFSEKSIVNTPLPPLPIEKRSMSVSHQRPSIEDNNDSSDDLIDDHSNYHMMNFEKEEIYTRPSKLNGNCEVKIAQIQRCISTRDQNYLNRADSYTAPPLPIRPKSAGYGNYDSPEIPPKSTVKDILAPPLPPRGVAPDKRISNPMLNSLNYCSIEYEENDLSANMIKSPHQKYSIVNIPLEDQIEADLDRFKSEHQIEFRDSGISTTSHDLNYAYICNDGKRIVRDLNPGENGDEQATNPPPIPRKMTNSVNNGIKNLREESSDQSIDKGDEPKTDQKF